MKFRPSPPSMLTLRRERYFLLRLRRLAMLLATLTMAGSVQGANAKWPHHATVGPFRIHSDYSLDEHRVLLAQLEHLRRDLAEQLDLPPSSEMIDVYLFREERVYKLYMQRYFPQVVPRRAMFIKANSPGNVFAFRSPELPVDLRHECTHAVLHSSLRYVPLWLDEGLAEYFEQAPERRENKHEHLRALQRWPQRRPRPLVELESLEQLAQMGGDEYRDAWAWVHYMLHANPAARDELRDYLKQLANDPEPTPLSARLPDVVENLDRSVAAHVYNWPTRR